MKISKSINYLLNETKGIELVICNHSTLSYPMHNHVSVYTIGLLIEGAIDIAMNDNTMQYQEGDTFVIHPYVPHSIQAVKEYSMLCICIRKQTIESVEFQYLKTNIMKMLTLIENLDKVYQEKIVDKLNEIQAMKDKIKDKGLKSRATSVNDVREQLERFPEKKISIDEMAQVAFVSKYHFIRNFKQEIGLTPHQFQIQNRIRKAQKLLQQTEKITEVALDTGFCDQSHFIKQFEKIVRLTPSKYKMSCCITEYK
ncbi:helix-turn-helix domain-containing protein [Anaerosporobacter sp.]|uniref:helix-turn-helix domain-containing protein n=1 Tax=Anaerosporobacter sp. TaxID=1872529 RepID=UPI00286F2299|nr:helix-turn-helix domain-containing protein [Anaerosporobacter sp.]